MTDKEHALMMMMFTRQTMYIQMLLDMLKSRDVIEDSDIPAFDSAVIHDPKNSSAYQRVDESYRRFAASIRLELPKLPPSPESQDQQL